MNEVYIPYSLCKKFWFISSNLIILTYQQFMKVIPTLIEDHTQNTLQKRNTYIAEKEKRNKHCYHNHKTARIAYKLINI